MMEYHSLLQSYQERRGEGRGEERDSGEGRGEERRGEENACFLLSFSTQAPAYGMILPIWGRSSPT
jgi:hypothetical protein